MKMRTLVLAALLCAFATPSLAGTVIIPVPVPVPPRVVVEPAPPPPPTIVIRPGNPEYWFWDEGRTQWYYYDSDRRPHYDRDHIYVDDGRHYYREGRDWRVGHRDMGLHKGWYKHEKRKEHREYKERKKERRHDRREREERYDRHDRDDRHGRRHGRGQDED